MKTFPIIAVLALTSPVFAAEPYKGEVQKIDAAEGKVTLKHGAIKKFDMEDGMTMVYRVANPAMVNGLKAGDKVSFDADKVKGKFTITKVEKSN